MTRDSSSLTLLRMTKSPKFPSPSTVAESERHKLDSPLERLCRNPNFIPPSTEEESELYSLPL